MHDELNLNLVYALSTRSQCQTKINARHIITTRAYRRVEVKSISLSCSYPVRVFMRTFFFQCRRIDFYACESTKVVSAKRPRCMRIDLNAKRPASAEKDVNQWLIIAVIRTTWAVKAWKKFQAWTGFELAIYDIWHNVWSFIYSVTFPVVHFLRVYYELTMSPAPRWLDSSVGRALHRHRSGHRFESRSGRNIFFRL